MCILTCLLLVTSVFWGLIIDEWDSHFDLLVTSVLLSWAGGRLSLLLRHFSYESKVFSQNLCAKKICWTLTSKSEVEVGGVNTVAAPEVEGAWARPGHALIKLLEFQKQHSHINTTSYISHFQHNCICQRPPVGQNVKHLKACAISVCELKCASNECHCIRKFWEMCVLVCLIFHDFS